MTDPTPLTLPQRLSRHWRTKLLLGAGLTVLFCTGYFTLQRFPLFAPAPLKPGAIDRWIGFSPGWAWVYQSMYLMLPLAWLARTRDELRRYALGFAFIASIGFGTFLLWPIDGPRPQGETSGRMYGVIVSYDFPSNSFPSLHVALAAYSAAVAIAMVDGPVRRVFCIVLPAWVVLIGYSTLAIKQHYWIDLPPGVLLGVAGQRLAWRVRLPTGAAASLLPTEEAAV